MSKTRRVRPMPAPPADASAEDSLDEAPLQPPRRRKWLLVVSVVLWLAWLAFLLMMALAE